MSRLACVTVEEAVGCTRDTACGDGCTRYAEQESDSALARWTTCVSRGAVAPPAEGRTEGA
ncbi:hypothetical protein [Streptomyces sp. NPDC004284]|uniref:hypothetical protein n=1 Tax=Streptomyces sp. NPDC004284 TaxID=3364695 RepID=UPI0036C31864